jgi:hypothetical protein
MEIRKEDLTEGQKKELRKLYRKYGANITIAVLLYVGFLCFANFLVVLVDSLYVHSAQFRFLMYLAGAIVAMSGLRGTIEEQHSVFVAKMKKVVGPL